MIISDAEKGILAVCGESDQVGQEMLQIMKAFVNEISGAPHGKELIDEMFHQHPDVVTNFCPMFVKSNH